MTNAEVFGVNMPCRHNDCAGQGPSETCITPNGLSAKLGYECEGRQLRLLRGNEHGEEAFSDTCNSLLTVVMWYAYGMRFCIKQHH